MLLPTHVKADEFSNSKTTLPWYKSAAAAPDTLFATPRPAVKVKTPTAPAYAPAINALDPRYPVASIPPLSPIWASKADVPFVDTPTKLIVTRFTPAGIPVKSIGVPEVEATAVPRTSLD